MRLFAVMMFVTTVAALAAAESYSGISPTCGQIIGDTPGTLEEVRSFCEHVPEGVVIGAYALDMLLFIKVDEIMARAMLADTLTLEQIVRLWMKGWKIESDNTIVTVTIEWGDVEVAKGQSTAFRGDQVTIRGQRVQ